MKYCESSDRFFIIRMLRDLFIWMAPRLHVMLVYWFGWDATGFDLSPLQLVSSSPAAAPASPRRSTSTVAGVIGSTGRLSGHVHTRSMINRQMFVSTAHQFLHLILVLPCGLLKFWVLHQISAFSRPPGSIHDQSILRNNAVYFLVLFGSAQD